MNELSSIWHRKRFLSFSRGGSSLDHKVQMRSEERSDDGELDLTLLTTGIDSRSWNLISVPQIFIILSFRLKKLGCEQNSNISLNNPPTAEKHYCSSGARKDTEKET
ncbi:hypothetical protein RRG08_021267 [Elysia crispata]|uniref:Uncharacterized protein n=1 Tax=Elysia crispata TaxID=231223 RepID=A0AAE1D522_9GAST|nr:hypothetical protein RRG08_021267 [Elysia crispata]